MTDEERRERRRARYRAQREADPEAARARDRAKRAANPDAARARVRKWRKANPTKADAWKLANPELVREQSRAYYAANKERIRTRNRENRERDPARVRDLYLRREYGLSSEQWSAMFASQDCRCAICFSDEPGTKLGWHTDHCHGDGRVRGILCNGCNIMLGGAKDSQATLRRAAAYLRKHGK